MANPIFKMILPRELNDILKNPSINVIIPQSREELLELALGGKNNMTYDVEYDVNGENIKEAYVTKCKNGIVANYTDSAMRRRDPNSMVIADESPTDKPTHEQRFGTSFEPIREHALEWFKNQTDIICMPFLSGNDGDMGVGYHSLLIIPKNAAFFALALADLQGFIPQNKIPNFFKPRAIIYVVPPFRHLYYNKEQVVVHNRLFDVHEVFSFNLYPGPSAKKGIYSVLLSIGEREGWTTLHASTVRVITPYEMELVITHEGASGGGKSEMLEPLHRLPDGRLLLGRNIINNEKVILSISDSCELHPVTDDMASCHPAFQGKKRKLVLADAENGWFLRVDHITKYGTEPQTERNTIHPKEPLVFINIDAVPGSTCLIWEPVEDAPGKPCPNPRVIIPRKFMENHVDHPVDVDIRSFGIRQPPSTKEHPNYGIAGLFHVLPPALAWLWRLVSPRGHKNPSIADSVGMQSEGVGSYWPFATGRKVDQANLLLDQIIKTPKTKFILVPNQYVGAYEVGFSGQWVTREYLSRRGGVEFRDGALEESRCPLLGYSPKQMKIDGIYVPKWLLRVDLQPEVGTEGYDAGAKMLMDFFKSEAKQFLCEDINPLGREIIEACLNDATLEEYFSFIPVM